MSSTKLPSGLFTQVSLVRQSWIPGRRSIPMFDATACGSGKMLGVTLIPVLSVSCFQVTV